MLLALAACDRPADHLPPQAGTSCEAILPAPDPLPRVRAEHETLGYWLGRTPDPDRIVMGVDEIAAMPRSAARFDLRRPPDEAAFVSVVRARLDEVRPKLAVGRLVRADGSVFDRAALDALSVHRARGLVGQLRVATAPIAIRCTPIRDSFFATPVDGAFDRNLCSTALPMEPVELLLPHSNGTMLVRTPYVFGWIDSGDSLSPPVDERDRWLGPPAVFIRSPSSVCDPPVQLPKGSRLPVAGGDRVIAAHHSGFCEADIPDQAVSTRAPLSRSELLRIAFSYLDAPYGWGGGNGVDCSSFLLAVFSRFAIELPRNSADQVTAGSDVLDLESLDPVAKLLRIEEAHREGIVLLELAGHIMLYLGRSEVGAMALHALAQYREACGPSSESTRLVRRVVVSDLRLGEGTSRGSLLERVRRAAVFTSLGVRGSPLREGP